MLAAGTEADRKGLRAGVGLHRRHDSVFRETIQRIHDGALGDVRLLCAYQVEHDVLLEAIRKGKPHNETAYAAMSTMTAIMGRMAAYSGKEVRREDAMQSNLSLEPQRLAWDADPPVLPEAGGAYPVALPGLAKVL